MTKPNFTSTILTQNDSISAEDEDILLCASASLFGGIQILSHFTSDCSNILHSFFCATGGADTVSSIQLLSSHGLLQ